MNYSGSKTPVWPEYNITDTERWAALTQISSLPSLVIGMTKPFSLTSLSIYKACLYTNPFECKRTWQIIQVFCELMGYPGSNSPAFDNTLDTLLQSLVKFICSNREHTCSSQFKHRMEDLHYKLLKLLQANPDLSQRRLAQELGISLGKTNYCLRALIEKGWVKADNFRRSTNKVAYAYLLTPHGIEARARATVQFLRRKVAEHEALANEIELLRDEVKQSRMSTDEPAKV